MAGFFLGLTFWGAVKGLFKLNGHATSEVKDEFRDEQYRRLNYHFKKNKFGFNTQVFADFDMMIEVALNDKFFNNILDYQNDEFRY